MARYIVQRRFMAHARVERWVVLDTATPRTGEASIRFPHTVVNGYRTYDEAAAEVARLESGNRV